MNNRDYLEALLDRARAIVRGMEKELRHPESDDRKFAPHVAQERLLKVTQAGESLKKLYEASLT